MLTVHDEQIDASLPYVLFHPVYTWKQRIVTDYTVRPLRVQLFKHGKCVYNSPDVEDIRKYCIREVDTLWDQIKRFENPQTYFVDLSKSCGAARTSFLKPAASNKANLQTANRNGSLFFAPSSQDCIKLCSTPAQDFTTIACFSSFRRNTLSFRRCKSQEFSSTSHRRRLY